MKHLCTKNYVLIPPSQFDSANFNLFWDMLSRKSQEQSQEKNETGQLLTETAIHKETNKVLHISKYEPATVCKRQIVYNIYLMGP